jgi:flagellar motor switch protein FliM
MPTSILRKMLKPKPKVAEVDPAVDGLAGVLGKSASVAGLSMLEVQLEAKSRAAKQCEATDFIATLPENALAFRMECETAEQFGLLALDMSVVEAIDTVLTGDFDDTQSPARPPTAIDAALCRPFLDRMLLEFSEILRELREGKPTDIYRTSRVEKDPSPHLFPEIPFLQIDIDFDFLEGKAKGHLAMMIPAINTEFTSSLPRPGESAGAWRAAFAKTVYSAPASFEVVLHRKKMSIGAILGMKCGDMLEIPARSLENLSIETGRGIMVRRLMKARLGEYQDMRAAKITQIGEDTPEVDTAKYLTAEVDL